MSKKKFLILHNSYISCDCMLHTCKIKKSPQVKVRGPFVEKICIEKDSYIDGI